jgi:Ni/Co efflux regulator RcnB
MNRLVVAVLAAMVFGIPAMAQQPAAQVRKQDPRCRAEGDRDHSRNGERRAEDDHRYNDRRTDRDTKLHAQKACAPRPGGPYPQATRAGDPNPYATRAGDPNPYATKAGAPNPYATRAGDPNPYATKAGTPVR